MTLWGTMADGRVADQPLSGGHLRVPRQLLGCRMLPDYMIQREERAGPEFTSLRRNSMSWHSVHAHTCNEKLDHLFDAESGLLTSDGEVINGLCC